jgi:predicted ATPase
VADAGVASTRFPRPHRLWHRAGYERADPEPSLRRRREEIESLAALLRRAADGEPGFAIVAGEAGVGKTRLVTELAGQAADSGFTVLAGHCVELGAEGLPLAPLIDALRTLARTTARAELADVLGPARRGLGRLLPELDPGALLAQNEGAKPAADGVQVSQLLELVLGLLGRLSDRRPLLLVLEDLHWSDHSTRELVSFLIRSLRGVRVVLLATYRSDELNRRHPLRPLIASWDRLRSVQHVELRRFEPGRSPPSSARSSAPILPPGSSISSSTGPAATRTWWRSWPAWCAAAATRPTFRRPWRTCC